MSTAEAELGTSDEGFAPRDTAQAEAFRLLSELQQVLLAAAPRSPGSGWLGRVKSRFSPPPAPISGLYLWGGVGRGKTYLMDRFYAQVPLPSKHRQHFHQFMRDIHEALHRLPPQPDPLTVIADQLARDTRLLCLDEFVVTDIADAMLLHGLLHALFERGVTLVTTSNTPPDDLYRNGLQRQRFLPAIELLKRYTRVFELDAGTDYRLSPLSQAGEYVTSDALNTDACLHSHFDQLAAAPVIPANTLLVNQRHIPLRRLASGVAWFDFAALCDTPRSSSDYIEIAREFHTVMVSDVPALTPQRGSAARRFLHLVDVFYDSKVRLILSTDVPLNDLFQGGLPPLMHERLHSRLVEMQSQEHPPTSRPEAGPHV
jgi:cell division protein ZapE